jgi:tripartite-type tricarboxylate transporter receptor subunit TctC
MILNNILFLFGTACVVGAQAQAFPSKPIRIITSEPGGGNDFGARIIGVALTEQLGQQVLIENRGAAGGVIAAETVARAAPDGYTLLYYGSNIWLLPFLRASVPYDPIRDFAPITLAVRAPNILVVHPSLPVQSVQALIALAKARPGELNYGSGATGSSTQMATDLFRHMAGIDVTHIPFKGNGPALSALIAGQVQMAFATPGSVSHHIKSGRLRALAVSTPQPSPLLSGLPTVASSVPGYEAVSMVGAFAPAKMAPALVMRLNQEFIKVLTRPDVREKFFNVGVETVGSTPEEFGGLVKSEMARLGKVIREAGLREK